MTADELIVKLTADIDQYNKNLDKAQKRTENFAEQSSGSVGKVNKAFALAKNFVGGFIAALSVREVIAFTRRAIEMGDALDQAAFKTGISVEALQRLRYAFDRVGEMASGDLDKALELFNLNMGKAKAGSEELVKAFNDLGISANATTEQAFREALEALAKIEDRNLRAAKAAEIFGRQAGDDIARSLDNGIAAIDEMAEKVPGLVSEENTKKAAALKDMFEDMATTVGSGLTNAFISATDAMTKFFSSSYRISQESDLPKLVDELDKKKKELEYVEERLKSRFLDDDEYNFMTRRRASLKGDIPLLEDQIAVVNSQTMMPPSTGSSGGSRTPFESKTDPVKAEQERIKLLNEANERQLDFIRAGEELAAREQAYQEEERDYWADKVEQWNKENEQLQEQKKRYLDMLDPLAQYKDQMLEVIALYEAGVISADDYAAVVAKIGENALQTNDELKTAASEFSAVWTSAMEDAIFSGKKLSDVIDGLIQDIARMVLRAAVLGPLEQSLTGAFSGIAPGDNPFAKIFGGLGKKAGGGIIQPNRVALVGERGPELVTTNSPARVFPNHALGGGGKPNVNVQVINNGTPQNVESTNVTQSPDGLIVSIVVNDLQKGGRIGRALGESYGVRRRA